MKHSLKPSIYKLPWLLAALLMLLILLLLLSPGLGWAQARTLPGPPQTDFIQHLDARLPIQTHFTDDQGRSVLLADYFRGLPVVLVFGYFRCPNLCSTLMEGVMQTFAMAPLAGDRYQLLAISIDPTETPKLAADKKRAYASMLGERAANLHLLTAREGEIRTLTQAAGFEYEYDEALQQYVHPAGFLVATPEGRISRYFMGVSHDPQEVASAVTGAANGRIGQLAEKLLLLCAHYDPQTGRYSVTIMSMVRTVCLLLVLALPFWVWRRSKRRQP